jgi:hypothetical protein
VKSGNYTTMTIAEAIAADDEAARIPVTFDRCFHITGPFFHGTKSAFEPGDLVVAGQPMNHDNTRTSNHVYFAALIEPAVWGAELATPRSVDAVGRLYVVEPTGPFEDDPNVTDKRFPGNVTKSYRSRRPLRVIEEIPDWTGHEPGVLQAMLDRLAQLRAQGQDVVFD